MAKYDKMIALMICLVTLLDDQSHAARPSSYNSPTLFMIGGVLSNNESKNYFGATVDVSIHILL